MKNAVQYNHKSDCWMVLTPEREFLGSAMKERDAKLFAMAEEMFDLLKSMRNIEDDCFRGREAYNLLCLSQDIVEQIEPILSINNQEGE